MGPNRGLYGQTVFSIPYYKPPKPTHTALGKTVDLQNNITVRESAITGCIDKGH